MAGGGCVAEIGCVEREMEKGMKFGDDVRCEEVCRLTVLFRRDWGEVVKEIAMGGEGGDAVLDAL